MKAKSPILQSYFHPLLWADERKDETESVKAFDLATWEDAYRLGYRPNEYPLPAIPLETMIFSFGVVIVAKSNYSKALQSWIKET